MQKCYQFLKILIVLTIKQMTTKIAPELSCDI